MVPCLAPATWPAVDSKSRAAASCMPRPCHSYGKSERRRVPATISSALRSLVSPGYSRYSRIGTAGLGRPCGTWQGLFRRTGNLFSLTIASPICVMQLALYPCKSLARVALRLTECLDLRATALMQVSAYGRSVGGLVSVWPREPRTRGVGLGDGAPPAWR